MVPESSTGDSGSVAFALFSDRDGDTDCNARSSLSTFRRSAAFSASRSVVRELEEIESSWTGKRIHD